MQANVSDSTSLSWKDLDTYEFSTGNSIFRLSQLDDWTSTDAKTQISNILGNLTVESNLLKDDLSTGMAEEPGYSKESLRDVVKFGNKPEDAAGAMNDIFCRFLKKQIRTVYLASLNTRLKEEPNPELTIFEGYLIPTLFTDDMHGGMGCARRIQWKRLNTEEDRIEYLMSLLKAIRHGEYPASDFNEADKDHISLFKKVHSEQPYFVDLNLGQSLASIYGYEPQ